MGEPRLHAELAWLGDGVARDVLIEIEGDRFGRIIPGVPPPAGAGRLTGLTLPGLANAHSHAFHRALRGRAQMGGGSFWTWREQMYGVAERLDPGSYYALARAVYAEMALAGITCVGEFHYLHHGPGGIPYDDHNVMGQALIEAAREAGIRITLLDTCYLTGGIGRAPAGAQLRFTDRDVHAWAERVESLGEPGQWPGPGARLGAAIHSVRAVPPEALPVVAEWAARRKAPLHVHLSEQPAENDECLAAYGLSPARLLAEHGALGARTTAVHATHLDDADIRLLRDSMTGVCMCPTTERDLADGIGPARALADAGSPLCVGSDQHAVIDLFEEARAVEHGERLRTRRRGHWSAGELLAMATRQGHAALGWPEAGRLEPGAYADLVTVSLDSVRTAGITSEYTAGTEASGTEASGAEVSATEASRTASGSARGIASGSAPGIASGSVPEYAATASTYAAEAVVFAATAADVRTVIASGREIVRDGHHLLIDDVPAALTASIAPLHRVTPRRS